MSFQPVVPITGYAGWTFLTRTLDRQETLYAQSPEISRKIQYFKENIGKITTAEALVADRRLLEVALGAFGLDGDIDNRFFIKKVLSDDLTDPKALANRLADKRYLSFSKTFGFNNPAGPATGSAGFADRIAEAFGKKGFEVALGEQDQSLRLALNLTREIGKIADGAVSDDGKWLSVMGSEPLRRVFDKAFNLPQAFAALDLDRQMDTYRAKAARLLGVTQFDQFGSADVQERLIRRFMVHSEIEAGPSGFGPAQAALAILMS
ncbi:uncharacterized protein DUF1217 [Rhodovulum imhoffii]|uniref:Uncharacterized protein DUF1217 n=1 Tax=Rhodovulum imhoffii TaxID=365340 RepID=A0A2T5BRX4_9RHOB|nr:DUF1217 domain-containing protein [Rhodovulum imhoffii]MBK5933731.1 hypothetical protein [Rhodovulum imhoffii]PTN01974.1 uncharacterized protein DUF1217 [Rhodovulum imhoffii]